MSLKINQYQYVLFLIVFLTGEQSFCQGNTQITFSENQTMSYLEPIIIYNSKKRNANTYEQYAESIRTSLDSLFKNEADKYHLSEKILLPKNNKKLTSKITEIFNVKKKDRSNIELSNDVKAHFQNTSKRYLMLMTIYPKLGYLESNLHYIRNSILNIFIIDMQSGSIVFYDESSSGSTLNRSYLTNLLSDLENVYINLIWD